ncbi:hypothetical protein ACFLXO_03505, partial [Chloroflexota bacterium]
MLKTPIAAKQIRVRLHWANSAEQLAEEVNGNLEAHSEHAIYGMQYQTACIPGEGKESQVRHY